MKRRLPLILLRLATSSTSQCLPARVTLFLDRCRTSGVEVLVGDPGRAFLPRHRLRLVVDYAVPDFGSISGGPVGRSGVFAFEADAPAATLDVQAGQAGEAGRVKSC